MFGGGEKSRESLKQGSTSHTLPPAYQAVHSFRLVVVGWKVYKGRSR